MERTRAISKTMISYLKRAREHKEHFQVEVKEFERGKRHLANIMGYDPDQMTQDHIDEAIKYLFPSGLFEPKARPIMKHPNLIFVATKDAQFDVEGRPYHHLYYTVIPNYYEMLGSIARGYNKLNDIEDKQLAKGVLDPPEEARYSGVTRAWLPLEEMQSKFLETIKEPQYHYLIKCLERLKSHPYSNEMKEMLDSLSKPLPGQSVNLNLPEIMKDPETGHLYTEMVVQQRVHFIKVKTILNGTGKILINNTHDILFFEARHHRQAVLFPLTISNMLDRVDIYADVTVQPLRLGKTAIATAIRYAVSTSIAAFKDPVTRERMRLAGLLTKDYRSKERKKFGQEGARRKFTWKKR